MGQTKTVSVIHFLLADDVEKNIDRRIANMHGMKRSIAAAIHPKLVCDTVADKSDMMAVLDGAIAADVDE
jgi:hypothetical protein